MSSKAVVPKKTGFQSRIVGHADVPAAAGATHGEVNMTPAENVHKLKARELKARKIAGYLINKLAESFEDAADDVWDAAALKAGVNPASAETRKRVLEMLRGIR